MMKCSQAEPSTGSRQRLDVDKFIQCPRRNFTANMIYFIPFVHFCISRDRLEDFCLLIQAFCGVNSMSQLSKSFFLTDLDDQNTRLLLQRGHLAIKTGTNRSPPELPRSICNDCTWNFIRDMRRLYYYARFTEQEKNLYPPSKQSKRISI